MQILVQQKQNATPLHADNTSAFLIAKNPIFYERTKHIEVDCHYICEAFASKLIALPHVTIDPQVVDAFTKALPCIKHQFFVEKFMLVNSVTFFFFLVGCGGWVGGVISRGPHVCSCVVIVV